MDMVTNLEVHEIKISGGQTIITAAYSTPNKTMYNSLFWLGKGLRWMMECKSNNMTRAIQPRDSRALWQLWEAHKQDFALAQTSSDAPSPILEFNHKILLPHPNEMRRYKNLKIQRVASEWHSYCHTCMSRDSADGTHIYHMVDYKDILEAQKVCEGFMSLHIGTGLPLEGRPGEWDTGLELPPLSELGREDPKGDLAFLSFAEPSITAPASGLPDAPDTAPGIKVKL